MNEDEKQAHAQLEAAITAMVNIAAKGKTEAEFERIRPALEAYISKELGTNLHVIMPSQVKGQG